MVDTVIRHCHCPYVEDEESKNMWGLISYEKMVLSTQITIKERFSKE